MAPPAGPQAALPDAARDALRRALPGVNLDAAQPLGEGWGAQAFRVPDPAGGDDWVLRVPRPQAHWAAADLEREVRLLPALEGWGLPTPRGAFAVLDAAGRFAGTLHRVVEGRPLRRSDARGARGERLAAQLAAFLSRLHAFPRERALALGVRDLDLWRDRYAGLVESCRPLLGPRSRAWLDATVERFHAEGGMAGAPRVLVHGDLAPQHLLVDDGGAPAVVIDLGDAMLADPALDFAALLSHLQRGFCELMVARYEGAVDRQLRRRARFYLDMEPLYSVEFGAVVRDGAQRVEGLRRFAARAAAATRAEQTPRAGASVRARPRR
ncbi:MAG: aminoglycoside phosphotransferase family protein [Dehalococcoidia bacterium]|nr:aminoglycoside phosphotransferase family protein [Dehalococcoidia bacterium]